MKSDTRVPSEPPAASSNNSVLSTAAYASSYSADGSPDALASFASSFAQVQAQSASAVAPRTQSPGRGHVIG